MARKGYASALIAISVVVIGLFISMAVWFVLTPTEIQKVGPGRCTSDAAIHHRCK